MKVYAFFYVILLSKVYSQEINHNLVNLISHGFYESETKHKQDGKLQDLAPKDNLQQFTHNKVPVDDFQLHDLDRQEILPGRSTQSFNRDSKSFCKFWCVLPENILYCCDYESLEDLEEPSGVCPLIRRACHVTDLKLEKTFQIEDVKDGSDTDLFQDESCIITSELLNHLRLYHQSHHSISNSNTSIIEIFGTRHKKIVIAPRFFEHENKEFGVFKEEPEDNSYVRPFFRALNLAIDIGTLTKVVPHVPHITKDPGREQYSDRYKIYDSYLPDDMLVSNEFESLLYKKDRKTKAKGESLLLSRIARYIYELP